MAASSTLRIAWRNLGRNRKRSLLAAITGGKQQRPAQQGGDGHGEPQLRADHSAPCAGAKSPPNALDWYGYWKLLDGLCDAAFRGRPVSLSVIGSTPSLHGEHALVRLGEGIGDVGR